MDKETNVTLSVKGNILTILVDLSEEHGVSGSGKSITVASTGGASSVPGREDIKVNVNVYKPTKRRG